MIDMLFFLIVMAVAGALLWVVVAAPDWWSRSRAKKSYPGR